MRILIAVCLLIFCGCSSPRISTTWKTEPVFQERYYRILVVAILPEADSLLRRSIETEAAKSLSGYGYYAVSALSIFGPKGLAASSQEETYLKLCNKGIDAVLTFALVPELENTIVNTGHYIRPNSFYYDRMWNYRKMQSAPDFAVLDKKYIWETIMFDLLTLQAISVIRTYPLADYPHNEITNKLPGLVFKRMIKEKLIQQKKALMKAF